MFWYLRMFVIRYNKSYYLKVSKNVFKKVSKTAVLVLALLAVNGCGRSLKDILSGDFGFNDREYPVAGLRAPSSIVVCRSKQCAPAKLSMSREYIFNSLLHLFENNNHQTALICTANPSSHTCLEHYVQAPIRVGITPAYMYIDSVKITDVIIGKGNEKINLVLNYNLTYNGQSPDCVPSRSILFARNVNHVLLEDAGYNCKMTAIGQTTVKNVFSIDYIDLDYGYIGGYYSIGLSGPAYGGGTGYMMIRLPNTSYPLNPVLTDKRNPVTEANSYVNAPRVSGSSNVTSGGYMQGGVQIFPIAKKASAPSPETSEEPAAPAENVPAVSDSETKPAE